MSQEKTENTYIAPNQVQKDQKQKTKDASQTNSLATIDITQATTLEEQAIITQNNLENDNSASVFTDNLESYYPGKYSENNVINSEPEDEKTYVVKKGDKISEIAKEHGISKEALINANLDIIHGTSVRYFITGETIIIPEKETKTNNEEKKIISEIITDTEVENETSDETDLPQNEITTEVIKDVAKEDKEDEHIPVSYVGEYTTNKSKGKIANLAKDVAVVQKLLLDLEILSQEDYDTEKPTVTEGEIEKEIPKTIIAIRYFQEYVKQATGKNIDGYLTPGSGGSTLKLLLTITKDEKIKRENEIIKKKEAEKKAVEERLELIKKNAITSIVGCVVFDDVPGNENTPETNLPNDVTVIQDNLLRLELLDKEECQEILLDDDDTKQRKLKPTIEAIERFQRIVNQSPTGYIEPNDATHVKLYELAQIPEEFEIAFAEYRERIKEEERIKAIKDTPTDKQSVIDKIKGVKEEDLGSFLRDYTLYNPKFIKTLIDGVPPKYKLSFLRLTIHSMSNAELGKISPAMDEYFYNTIKKNGDFEKNIKYLARLKEGRRVFGLDNDHKPEQPEKKKKKEKEPELIDYKDLKGKVGQIKSSKNERINDQEDIRFIQELLNKLTYVDPKTKKEIKYLDDDSFSTENPQYIYDNPFQSSVYDPYNNSDKTNSFNKFNYLSYNIKPTDFKDLYRKTDEAIHKFQKINFGVEYKTVDPKGKTIIKLVEISNKANLARHEEAIEKAETKRINKIKNYPTEIGVVMGKVMIYTRRGYNYLPKLKEALFINPLYVRMFISCLEGEKRIETIKRLLDLTSDSNLYQLDSDLDFFFFHTIHAKGNLEEDIIYLLRLKTGRKKYGVNKFTTIEQIISKDDWRHQNKGYMADNEAYGTGCKLVAEKMIYRALYEDLDEKFLRSEVLSNPNYKHKLGTVGADQFLSLIKEDKSEYKNIEEGIRKQSTFYKAETFKKGIDYINRYLEDGIPVLAGVDHTFNRHIKTLKTSKIGYGYNEGTTDHYVVIVGRGTTEDGKRYYQFYDPGTSRSAFATDEKCRLIENEDGYFVGSHTFHGNPYYLSMVVLFTKDFKQYVNEIGQNKLDEVKLSDHREFKKGDFKQ